MMHCLMKTVKKQDRKKEADFLMVRENRQVEIQHRQKRFTGPLFPCFIPHEKATKNQPFGGAVCFFGVFLLPLFRRKGREVSSAVQKCFTRIFDDFAFLVLFPTVTKFCTMAKRTERIEMRVTPYEKALLQQRMSETNLETLADYIRSMTFGYKVVSKQTTEEKQTLGAIKNGLLDLQRLRNLIHKDARAELLQELEEVIKNLKSIIDDRKM